jgi:hypothetical protein
VAFAAGAAIFGVMYLFMARREANYFLLIFSLLYLIRMNLPLYSSLLVSGGRKERFSNACACALLTYILGGIAYLTFLFSLKIVVHFINGYSIFGYTFAPCDFNLKVALIAFSFVPLLFIPQVFPGIFNFGIKFLVSAVLLGLVIGITVELSRNDSNTQNIVAFSSFILSWSALIGALYYHFTRRDLVSNANPSQPAANF